MVGSITLGCDEDRERATAPVATEARVAPPPAPPAAVAPPSPALVAAQAVIEERCGDCHRSDLVTAVPEALAVFDLWDPEWLARLDDTAHESMVNRLEDIEVEPEELASVRAAIAEVQGARLDPDCTQS